MVPKASSDDYEAEMVAVVGKAGHCTLRPTRWTISLVTRSSTKARSGITNSSHRNGPRQEFDASGGFGPDFVTADEVPPGGKGLRIQTRLNGETMQDANTETMIFDARSLRSSQR